MERTDARTGTLPEPSKVEGDKLRELINQLGRLEDFDQPVSGLFAHRHGHRNGHAALARRPISSPHQGGDRLIEIAAGFAIMLVVTGLYLWWPRDGRGFGSVLVPQFSAKGRQLWKSLHLSIGFYVSLFLVVFLLSGLTWAGIWGEKFIQAWSTFPAEKWDNVPLSDKAHASMNHGGIKDVPWTLEQTPMPASGSDAGVTGTPEGQPVTLDAIVALPGIDNLAADGPTAVRQLEDRFGVGQALRPCCEAAEPMSGPDRDQARFSHLFSSPPDHRKTARRRAENL